MTNKFRKPQQGGSPQKVIPPLGFLFGTCSLLFFALAPSAPWIAGYCIWLGKFSLLLGLGCLGYWLYIRRSNLKNWGQRQTQLNVINTDKMGDFLYQVGAFSEDPYNSAYVDLPKVKEAKNGIKIEASTLRVLLTSEKFIKQLEGFLNQNGCDVFVISARYHSDGWVYYTLMPGIRSNQMRF